MQAETGPVAALTGLCLFSLSACDARPEDPPHAVDSARPAAAVSAPAETGTTEAPAAPEDAVETPEPAPPSAPRRRVRVTSVAEPENPEPPVEVEGVVITGPRDGETLGEYRARADQVFRRLDTDGDRRLDREEVTSGVGRLSLRTAIEQADIDLDDAISTQEFGDVTTRAFQRLDADGNGVITEAEMEAGDPLGSD